MKLFGAFVALMIASLGAADFPTGMVKPPKGIKLLRSPNTIEKYINENDSPAQQEGLRLAGDVYEAFQKYHMKEVEKKSGEKVSVAADGTITSSTPLPVEVLRMVPLVHADRMAIKKYSGSDLVSMNLGAGRFMIFNGRGDTTGTVYYGPLDYENVVDWISKTADLSYDKSHEPHVETPRGKLVRELHSIKSVVPPASVPLHETPTPVPTPKPAPPKKEQPKAPTPVPPTPTPIPPTPAPPTPEPPTPTPEPPKQEEAQQPPQEAQPPQEEQQTEDPEGQARRRGPPRARPRA